MKRIWNVSLVMALFAYGGCGEPVPETECEAESEADAKEAPVSVLWSCYCTDGRCEVTGNRVPEADHLCVGIPDGEATGGVPDDVGCPNTCNCECYDEECYLGECTLIGSCGTCPVFR